LPLVQTRLKNIANATKFYIRWFKLDNNFIAKKEILYYKNLEFLNDENEDDAFNEDDDNNIFISTPTNFTNNSATSMAKVVTSNLIFKFKNSNDLLKANGFYMCKLDDRSTNDSIKLYEESHYIQRISINGKNFSN
jgi:hypothetical protein